jgi:hypothetical protein
MVNITNPFNELIPSSIGILTTATVILRQHIPNTIYSKVQNNLTTFVFAEYLVSNAIKDIYFATGVQTNFLTNIYLFTGITHVLQNNEFVL